MHKISILIFLLCASFGFSQTELYRFPKIESTLSIPISIPVPEITRLINSSVNGIIFEDNSYTDNENDQFKVKVEKSAEIKLTALKENRFLIEVPLKIWAEQGYGGLGYYTYQDTNFKVVMKFISSVKFNQDWTLETQTKTFGFEWREKPVLDYGSVKIPISSVIETKLTEQQAKFTTVIDNKIKESFDLKPYLLIVWNQFAEPINVSPEYKSWLKISPQKIYMSPVKIYSDFVKSTIGVDLLSETYLGQKPSPAPLLKKIPYYIPKEAMPSEFKLKTTANISFEDATKLAKNQFQNQEFVLTSEKNKVKITDLKVYSEDLNMVIEVVTEGQVKGTVIIKGFPVYDKSKQKIVLTNTDFSLKTKNILQKSLSVLFEGKIKKMIQDEYGIPMQDIISNSKQSLMESFNKEYYPGIFLKGNVRELSPVQVLLFNQYITVVIDTTANLQLEVSGLNFN